MACQVSSLSGYLILLSTYRLDCQVFHTQQLFICHLSRFFSALTQELFSTAASRSRTTHLSGSSR